MPEGLEGVSILHERTTNHGVSAKETTLHRLFERQEERKPMSPLFAFNEVLRSQVLDIEESQRKNKPERIAYVKGLQESVILMIEDAYLPVDKQTALRDYCTDQMNYWETRANRLPTIEPEQKDQATFNALLFKTFAKNVQGYHTVPQSELPENTLQLAA